MDLRSKQPKKSQHAVAYQFMPNGVERCSYCAMFQPAASCSAVTGTIGLYAKYDGFAVWLRAPREDGQDHVCALEPQTMHNFLEFVMTIKRHASIAHHVVREKIYDGE